MNSPVLEMSAPPDPAAHLGVNIRRRRQALGLSLDTLARESGVSSTMLSEVERSVKNPTVRLAYQIARALGCTLTELLEEEAEPIAEVTRAIRRRTLVDPATGAVSHAIPSPFASHGLEMIWLELPPFSQSTECASVILGTYHQILAVRGQLAIIVDDQHYELLAGDSLVCMPQHRLALRNVGEDLAELLHIAEKHCMRR